MAQPITVKPVLAKVGNMLTLPTVTFATGRHLGASDVGDTTEQSIYVMKDDLTATGLGTERSNVGMGQQTMVAAATAVGHQGPHEVGLVRKLVRRILIVGLGDLPDIWHVAQGSAMQRERLIVLCL